VRNPVGSPGPVGPSLTLAPVDRARQLAGVVDDRGRATVGIEEEFLLVDPATRQVLPRAKAVIDAAADIVPAIQSELTLVQLETATPVCTDMDELYAHLRRLRTDLATAAERTECRLVATGTPVLCPSSLAPLTDKPRYHRMAHDYGALLDGAHVCGCHVHVGVATIEDAVQISNHLRPWLPVLLALTANSPFSGGRDTGYASWRAMAWSRWPSSGPPPFFDSAEQYEALVDALVSSGVVLDRGMIYWDVRPSEHVPTLEIRVSDVAATAEEAVLLAALVRALVAVAMIDVGRGDPAPPIPEGLLRAAHWRAAREGLEGFGVDPLSGEVRPAFDLLDRLVHRVRPALEDCGDVPLVTELLDMLKRRGSGAARQRQEYARAHQLADVVDLLVAQTRPGGTDCRW
jgi:carboxylate-amine ligase